MRNGHYFWFIVGLSDFFYLRDRDHFCFSVEFVD